MNDRDQIKKEYSDWVDEICEACDWKTSITMEEVQAVYSKIALKYAMRIITEALETNPDRIEITLLKKKIEIQKLLDENV